MKPAKQIISLSLDSGLIEKLKKLAEEDDRPLSQYVNFVLKKHIASKSSKQ